MNYLGHASLSPQSRNAHHNALLFGNLIGDHVRGSDLSHLPRYIARGVRLHRAIDREFDHHPAIIHARRAFPQGLRRFAGITLDVYFDHWLAKHFDDHHASGLSQIQCKTAEVIQYYQNWVPSSQRNFFRYLIREQLFLEYRFEARAKQQVQSIAQRLSKGDGLLQSMHWFASIRPAVESDWGSVYKDMTDICDDLITAYE
ncbi:MAG: DUF479 domain-containing protein [Gammaproteobacteria bacterium]|nr:DUF479 domain-containing protein [Gammaproteobacteria bacterium]